MNARLPKLYDELADWWQLVSPTSDYIEEAAFFIKLFKTAGTKTILELGCGGGNIAFYMKQDFTLTLSDLSPKMVSQSKIQNPELTHHIGDMRTMRLGQQFDGIFIHDAICYMLNEKDLLAAFKTAYEHCRPGGLLVVAPDEVRENFKPFTHHEGSDDGARALRYMYWAWDEDPSDTMYNYDFVLALREGKALKTITDRQICGLFPRRTWLDLLIKVGFKAKVVNDPSTADESHPRTEVFIAKKP